MIDFMLANSRIREVEPKLFQLTTVEPLGEIRQAFRKNKLAVRVIPRLLPPEEHQYAMQLTYPPKLEGDTYRERQHRKDLWMTPTSDGRNRFGGSAYIKEAAECT